MVHRFPRGNIKRKGSPSTTSEQKMADVERGYSDHKGTTWLLDKQGTKRRFPNRPNVYYQSPIANYERHQMLRTLRKAQTIG